MTHAATEPGRQSVEVAVVGAGIIGLTTAIAMRRAGFSVRIVAEQVAPHIVSTVAAAIWYPFEAYPRERVVGWARHTLDVLREEVGRGIPGVSAHEMVDLFDAPVPDPWWSAAVPSWRRCSPDELPPGYVDGLVSSVSLIEPTPYLDYLYAEATRIGIVIERQRVESLADIEARLVVNCAGLTGGAICGDDGVYPIRGVVLRTSKLDITRSVTDDIGPNALAYVVPRSTDAILGGTAERGSFDLTATDVEVEGILDRCRAICPAVETATVLEVKVGLRPGRATVRCEADPVASNVFHNYGHGGSGFTLCWGCAAEVVRMAQEFLAAA